MTHGRRIQDKLPRGCGHTNRRHDTCEDPTQQRHIHQGGKMRHAGLERLLSQHPNEEV